MSNALRIPPLLLFLSACYAAHSVSRDAAPSHDATTQVPPRPWVLDACRPTLEAPRFLGEGRVRLPLGVVWTGTETLVSLYDHGAGPRLVSVDADGVVRSRSTPVSFSSLVSRDGRVLAAGALRNGDEWGDWGVWSVEPGGQLGGMLGFAGQRVGPLTTPWFVLGWSGTNLVVVGSTWGEGTDWPRSEARRFFWAGPLERLPSRADASFLPESVPVGPVARDERGEIAFAAGLRLAPEPEVVLLTPPDGRVERIPAMGVRSLELAVSTSAARLAIVQVANERRVLNLDSGESRPWDFDPTLGSGSMWAQNGGAVVAGWNDRRETVIREYDGELSRVTRELVVGHADDPTRRPGSTPAAATTIFAVPGPCGLAVIEQRPSYRADGTPTVESYYRSFDCCP